MPHPLPTRYNRRSQPTMRVAGRRFAQPAPFQTTMTVLARLRDLFTNLDSNKDSAKLMAHDLGLPVARSNFDGSAASAWDSLRRWRTIKAFPALIAPASQDAAFAGLPRSLPNFCQYRATYPATAGEAKVLATYRAWVISIMTKCGVIARDASRHALQQIFTDVYLLDRPAALKRFSREELEQEFQQLGRLRSHDEKSAWQG
ncbi:MAG: hypothetical protein H6668_13195 [Ardenticatenaceae bacterium]|nr:hypothetical protein [Ardenticatenaceae bacterium]